MSKKICITRDIEGVERVEKIVSLNPDKCDWFDFYEMLNAYASYCYQCGARDYISLSEVKTFKEWLDTEI